jgi:hypothetical protein
MTETNETDSEREKAMKKMVLGMVAAMAVCLALGSTATAATTVKTVVLPGGMNDNWTVTFVGGFKAAVLIKGDGDTDLDLYVYDQNGNLIAFSEGPTDREAVTFTPRWTGKFKIKVVNRSRFIANRYTIAWGQ